MKTKPSISREAGTTLIVVLSIAAILGAVLGTYLTMTSTENIKVKRSIGWNSALPMAEAGIEEAFSHLMWNPTNYDWSGDGWVLNTNTGMYSKTRVLGDGYYSVSIDGWIGGIATITSQGYGAWTGSNYISRTVEVQAQMPQPILPSGLIAFDIGFGGTFNADSFDSRTNLYSTLGRYDAKKRTANALVASRPGSTGFNVSGTVDIRGSVATGPGGIVTVSGSGIVGDLSYNAKGTIQPGHVTNNFSTVYPPIAMPGTNRIVTPVGGTIAGQSYNYVLTNNRSLFYLPSVASGATMFIGAPDCRVVIAGGTEIPIVTFDTNPTNPTPSLQLSFGGASLNFPKGNASIGNGPPQYWLLGLPTCAQLKWTGGTFYGVIYAPTMALSSQGNAELQGAIVASSFSCNGTFDFHYDQATGVSSAKPFKIQQWAER